MYAAETEVGDSSWCGIRCSLSAYSSSPHFGGWHISATLSRPETPDQVGQRCCVWTCSHGRRGTSRRETVKGSRRRGVSEIPIRQWRKKRTARNFANPKRSAEQTYGAYRTDPGCVWPSALGDGWPRQVMEPGGFEPSRDLTAKYLPKVLSTVTSEGGACDHHTEAAMQHLATLSR